MPAVSVLNWNIQNFGQTKAGLADVVKAIAQVVVASGADIFVMLEMNTTKMSTAFGLAQTMRLALESESKGLFPTCVLSPNTGLEFYAYFVRDPKKTTPYVLTGPTTAAGFLAADTIGAAPGIAPAHAQYTLSTAAGVVGPFPLMTPDLPVLSSYGRQVSPAPVWSGADKGWRRPTYGQFKIAGAAGSGLLPIVACHFDPDPHVASGQLAMMSHMSVLKPPGGTIPRWMLVGDFNIDVTTEGKYYAPLTSGPGLGANVWLGANTLMATPAAAEKDRLKQTDKLAVRMIDEMATRGDIIGSTTVVTPLADQVTARRLRLCQSVQHYQELDKRGFVSNETQPYQRLVSDYGHQLAGDPSHQINIHAALIGSRLISDHLPVLLTVQVP